MNSDAVLEMERIREKCTLDCTHPLEKIDNSINICLFNIRSWNLHLKHFLEDKFHAGNSSVFGFAETDIKSQNHSYVDISEYLNTWKNIHKPTKHSLTICYDTSRVTIESNPTVTSDFEIMSVVMEIGSKFFPLTLVYKPPLLNKNTFIYQLQMQLDNLLTSKYQTIVPRDFNMDQLLEENVAVFEPMINRVSLSTAISLFSS